jgi:Stress responsive A/B Barrel Domain
MISSIKYVTARKSVTTCIAPVSGYNPTRSLASSLFLVRQQQQQQQQTIRSIMSQIKHVVMFNFKDETSNDTIQAIKDGLLNLPKEINLIQDYELGVDMLLESGQKHPAGKNRLLCWSCTFDTVDDYETYSNHPVHTQLLENYIKPNLLPASRAAIQYQIKEK